MKPIKEQVQMVEDRFNVLSMRERIIVCVVLIVGLYFLWNALVHDYLLATDEQVRRQTQEIKGKLENLGTQIDSLSELIGRNPTSVLIAQLNALKKEDELQNQKIRDLIGAMITPKEMNRIVENVIKDAKGLSVVDMESLRSGLLQEQKSTTIPRTTAATTATATATATENTGTPQAATKVILAQKPTSQVYKHTLKVILTGNYFDTYIF